MGKQHLLMSFTPIWGEGGTGGGIIRAHNRGGGEKGGTYSCLQLSFAALAAQRQGLRAEVAGQPDLAHHSLLA